MVRTKFLDDDIIVNLDSIIAKNIVDHFESFSSVKAKCWNCGAEIDVERVDVDPNDLIIKVEVMPCPNCKGD